MKIYTKTGDNGSTSILGGTQVSKADMRLDVYGTIDELNAHIGLVFELCNEENDKIFLHNIQNDLFSVGFIFATDWEKYNASKHNISSETITTLEKEIDKISDLLPSLNEFLLPCGSIISAHIHIARTVCRRAERLAVAFSENVHIEDLIPRDLVNQVYLARPYKKKCDPNPMIRQSICYLNRLSDYLFVLARKYC